MKILKDVECDISWELHKMKTIYENFRDPDIDPKFMWGTEEYVSSTIRHSLGVCRANLKDAHRAYSKLIASSSQSVRA